MGRFLARILVLALVVMVACTSPVAALGVDLNTTTPAIPEDVAGAGTSDTSNGRVLVAPVLLGAAVLEGGEALALILSGGVMAGIVVAQPNPNDNIFKCLDNMRHALAGFFADVLKDPSGHKKTTIDGHTVDVYTERHNWFQKLQARFSYGESKRQGIPVKDHHEDLDNFHEMPNTWVAYSSNYLFACQLDKDNGCPKQIRYYGKDGKPDLDIDFSKGAGVDRCGGGDEFPHIHLWTNGVRSPNHLRGGIAEIIKNWKCRNYNFKLHKWGPPVN